MKLKQEFSELVDNLKTQRDEINLKLHLASMEVKDEFEKVESTWNGLMEKAADIADDTIETSEDVITKAKIVGEELKDAYHRISARLSD